MAPSQKPQPGEPLWWVERLWKELAERRKYADLMRQYYSGDHPLPMIQEKAREGFQRLLRQARSNYVGLVVDATSERLQIDGFRLGDAETGDKELWRIWQANNMDADSDLQLTEAVKTGRAFALVAPNPDDATTPLITAEDVTQAIVAYEPGSRRKRRAGLKTFTDDWTGDIWATLYADGLLYKYKAKAPRTGVLSLKWEKREVRKEEWPAPNPLEVVPLVEIPNRPDLLGEAHSEIEDLLDNQDRINKTLIDRLMAQEFTAFRQKLLIGYEIPTDENDQPIEPFKAAVDRLWIVEDGDVKVHEFEATDLRPYLDAIEADVQHMAARSRTPAQYLLGKLNNVNGETLKATESGLVAKVRQRQRPLGEGVEEIGRLALQAAGDTRDLSRLETIWHNPEFRTEGELVDALVKMHGLGVPLPALWERWGATQTEIAKWQALRQADAQRILGGDAASLYGPKPPLELTAGSSAAVESADGDAD